MTFLSLILISRHVLTVFAAASLKGVGSDFVKEYETLHPDTTVQVQYAGSQVLVRQLSSGAKPDAILTADKRWIDEVVKQKLNVGNPNRFAANVLCVATSGDQVKDFKALAKPGIKLALGDKSVPVGLYSLTLLDKGASLFGANWRLNVISNVVTYELDVKGVVAKVKLGAVDAGVVYVTDATAAKLPYLPILKGLEVRADYYIAPLSQDGKAFVAYVNSARAKAILRRWGFKTP